MPRQFCSSNEMARFKSLPPTPWHCCRAQNSKTSNRRGSKAKKRESNRLRRGCRWASDHTCKRQKFVRRPASILPLGKLAIQSSWNPTSLAPQTILHSFARSPNAWKCSKLRPCSTCTCVYTKKIDRSHALRTVEWVSRRKAICLIICAVTTLLSKSFAKLLKCNQPSSSDNLRS